MQMEQVWAKLKGVKMQLKNLHKVELSRITNRIRTLEKDLSDFQTALVADHLQADLYRHEKDILGKLRHWRYIEKSYLHQKAHIRWLKHVDKSFKLFHAAIKERKIYVL